jgi:membrane protease YdiL (CAAX protease family)
MMLITTFIGLLLEWNMMISFPEWLLQFDINSEAIVIAFLKMDTIWDLFYTILVVAIVPAIGEELLFRGYLQQKLGNWLSNPHTAILITALLFSAIHFDIQGMIPRFALGVLLGYLFYWSNSLWLPILAHFVNNAQAVIFSYPLFKVDIGGWSPISELESVNPMLAVLSLASVSLLLYILHQNIHVKKADKINL